MRSKFLSLLTGFLLITIVISSCLDTDNRYEISADATVHSFALDTVYGVNYKFSIDQVNRLIFNADSMPVSADTIIDSIKITDFTGGYVITSGTPDTILNIDNYQDLSLAATEGMRFTIRAGNGDMRDYTLRINIHKQDPDSLHWTDLSATAMTGLDDFARADIRGHQKAVVFGPYLYIYVWNETEGIYAYRTEVDSHTDLQRISLNGLPAQGQVTSVTECAGRLYLADANGDVYASADGELWQKEESLSGNVIALIADFDGSLTAIVDDNGNYFASAEVSDGGQGWILADSLPKDGSFPTSRLYAVSYATPTSLPQLMVVGHTEGEAERIIPWTYDGTDWIKMDPSSSYDSYCQTDRLGNDPALLYYGGRFYMTGERLEAFYRSENGLAWYVVDKKFRLPAAVRLCGDSSMAVDRDNYIWLVTGADDNHGNQLWRGRLNSLGFAQP